MAKKKPQAQEPILFFDEKQEFIPVDSWVMKPEDMIFKTFKGVIATDVSGYYGADEDPEMNAFIMTKKRSYGAPNMREHIIQYLNYFEKFYDIDHMLYSAYCRIKYLIDFEPGYTKQMFFFDLMKYIIRGPVEFATIQMVTDNYTLNLNYKSRTSSSLQYNNLHAMILMKISIQMNQIIPLLCHFMHKRKIQNTNDFLFEIYDKLIEHPDIDIYGKLYETAYSNVMRSVKQNKPIWDKQDIRGINKESSPTLQKCRVANLLNCWEALIPICHNVAE